jgi:hypothetical protein
LEKKTKKGLKPAVQREFWAACLKLEAASSLRSPATEFWDCLESSACWERKSQVNRRLGLQEENSSRDLGGSAY